MWKYFAYNYLYFFIGSFTATLGLIWGFVKFYLQKNENLNTNWHSKFFVHCVISLIISVPSAYFVGNIFMHDKRMRAVEELNLFRQEIYRNIDKTSEDIQEEQSKKTGETEWPVKTLYPLRWPATTTTYWQDKMKLLYPEIQHYFSPGTSSFFYNNIFNFINEPRRTGWITLEYKIIPYHSFTTNEAKYLLQSTGVLLNRLNKETQILFKPLSNSASLDAIVTPLRREIGIIDYEHGIVIHPDIKPASRYGTYYKILAWRYGIYETENQYTLVLFDSPVDNTAEKKITLTSKHLQSCE
jgi:hypothetical protein